MDMIAITHADGIQSGCVIQLMKNGYCYTNNHWNALHNEDPEIRALAEWVALFDYSQPLN